jgi:protease I
VTWKILTENNIGVTFATPDGKSAKGDESMLSGRELGIWSGILKADYNGVNSYNKMVQSKEFQNPVRWFDVKAGNFDGIILPGGHAPRMKHYLESEILQNLIAEFFKSKKLIGAICHGVVLASRSKRPDGKSILYGYKVTALLKTQELIAWALTFLWLKNYYRTYSETVQGEVTQSLAQPKDFLAGKTPLRRDSPENLEPGFTVEDRNLITARWPGDAHKFGNKLVEYLRVSLN